MTRTRTRKGALDPAGVEALVRGDHGDPFGILGPHEAEGGGLVVRTFQPQAARAWLIDANSGRAAGELSRAHAEGLFVGTLPNGNAYRLRLEVGAGNTVEIEDPYRFPPLLGEMDAYLIAEGNHLRLYEKLGAHPMELEGVAGVAFLVWAPNARRVSVVGDFNGWDGRRHPMRKRVECGVWELFVPGIARGETYKYEIKGAARRAAAAEGGPGRVRRRAAAAHRLGGARPWRPGVVGSGVDDGPRRRRRPQRADVDLRVPSRLLDAGTRRRQSVPRPTTSSPSGWCPTWRRWASPTSSCCRCPSTRSTAPGATSRSGCTRRPAAMAIRRRSRASSTAATRTASA